MKWLCQESWVSGLTCFSFHGIVLCGNILPGLLRGAWQNGDFVSRLHKTGLTSLLDYGNGMSGNVLLVLRLSQVTWWNSHVGKATSGKVPHSSLRDTTKFSSWNCVAYDTRSQSPKICNSYVLRTSSFQCIIISQLQGPQLQLPKKEVIWLSRFWILLIAALQHCQFNRVMVKHRKTKKKFK